MKKTNIYTIFMAVVMLTLALPAHSGAEPPDASKKAGKLAKWKREYIEKIEKLNKTGGFGEYGFSDEPRKCYRLIKINNDRVPELHVTGADEATGNLVCTYHNGKVYATNFQRTVWSYRKGKNLISNHGGHMGYYFDIIYKMKKGRLREVAVGEQEAVDVMAEEFNYRWNGKKVDEGTYKKMIERTFDYTKASKHPKAYTKKGIISAIRNYK